jgi:hypothetical protein
MSVSIKSLQLKNAVDAHYPTRRKIFFMAPAASSRTAPRRFTTWAGSGWNKTHQYLQRFNLKKQHAAVIS